MAHADRNLYTLTAPPAFILYHLLRHSLHGVELQGRGCTFRRVEAPCGPEHNALDAHWKLVMHEVDAAPPADVGSVLPFGAVQEFLLGADVRVDVSMSGGLL